MAGAQSTAVMMRSAEATPLEHVSLAGLKSRVCYFYDGDMGSFYYGAGHPMKPHRLRMTHNLLISYGIYKKMEIYRPHPASHQEMTQFHTADYIDFLRRVTPDNVKDYKYANMLSRFCLGQHTDCPVFDGMYEFCQLYTGGSIDGAMRLNHGLCDIAVNWSGGLHHAKKSEASGFCYVNDIVLAILELLKYHARVLYIDIDIHHGDGVEEAFYTTDRVMTVSFHKFGDFFPGTGDLKDIGTSKGKHYSVNFPMDEGIDDKSYQAVFQPVIQKVMEVYRPSAVVLQCGADSLTGDRLGCFNLTLKGHGECVRFVKSFGLPMLVLGGGGYNIRNVSRCWTYETSVLLDTTLSNTIPFNDFLQYYGPDFKLHLTPAPDLVNKNTPEELKKTRLAILQNLSSLEHAPSVQMQAVPPDLYSLDELHGAEEPNPDIRINQRDADKMVFKDNEYYADDRDQDRVHSSGQSYGAAAAGGAGSAAAAGAGATTSRRPVLIGKPGAGAGAGAAAAALGSTLLGSSSALATSSSSSSSAIAADSKDFKSALPGVAVPSGSPTALAAKKPAASGVAALGAGAGASAPTGGGASEKRAMDVG